MTKTVITRPVRNLWEAIVVGLWKSLFYLPERHYGDLIQKDPDKFLRLLYTNPVIVSQARSEMVIKPDWYLGHRMPLASAFIGPDRFISFDDVLNASCDGTKKIILNIGDSSTSGWDSTVIAQNRARMSTGQEPILPFFQYKTYSDHLREMLDTAEPGRYLVINAGVPAHSSLQGRRYLDELLQRFEGHGIKVHAVTIYLGNNDCAWNGNYEDRNLLPAKKLGLSAQTARAIYDCSIYGKVVLSRVYRRRATDKHYPCKLCLRVASPDYKQNLREMLLRCRTHGAHTLFIEPVIPIFWRPGRRTKDEELFEDTEVLSNYDGMVLNALRQARELWAIANASIADVGLSPLAVRILERAAELDFITPRIKNSHRRQLRALAEEENLSLIQVDIPRGLDEVSWFIDYCHPRGDSNRELALAITKAVHKCASQMIVQPQDISERGTSALVSWLSRLGGGRARKKRKPDPSPTGEIYTLY